MYTEYLNMLRYGFGLQKKDGTRFLQREPQWWLKQGVYGLYMQLAWREQGRAHNRPWLYSKMYICELLFLECLRDGDMF